jgi:Kef-type K+ transport system membrane component KefB/mannitol/fructose-specific phosphotransferase system IIA component (Ntr-type)
MKNFISKPFFYLLLVFCVPLFASASHSSDNLIDLIASLSIQLGTITIAAVAGHQLFDKIHLPSVLGELLLGIIIGPYLLGSIPFFGFPEGIFPLITDSSIPVSPYLYSIASLASIILLFYTGLETDFSLLIRYSVTGIAVGISGVIFSFAGGSLAGSYFLQTSVFDPRALFLGVISTETSVGITARILSEKHKLDSPEGVTILAGAVIDDVLGIIILAVVSGLSAIAPGTTGTSSLHGVQSVALKAIGVWLGFTIFGILIARPFSHVLKTLHSFSSISVFSLGIALILAGIFEKAGLAMIIGAYITGLSLSRTDLNDTIRDTLETVYVFLVPIFFVVMGMLVNTRSLFSPQVLYFGFIYTIIALIAKIAGCGCAALFLNFNTLGALRIGIGMVPRGEVALIIAGIGLSGGLISEDLFSSAIMMTLVTTIFTPPLLSKIFSFSKRGTKTDFLSRETISTVFDFSSMELNDLLTTKLIQAFRYEGFYVHSMPFNSSNVYQLKRDDIIITMTSSDTVLDFRTDKQDVFFVKTIVYETLIQVNDTINRVKDLIRPEVFLKGLTDQTVRSGQDIRRIIDTRCIVSHVKSRTKKEAIEELLNNLYKNGFIQNREVALDAVLKREESMSTGMQYGIALPHAKTDAVDKIRVVVGLSREGIDFNSIDGELSRIIVLVLSPLNVSGPHIRFLASISALLNSSESREQLLLCRNATEIYHFFRDQLRKEQK